MWLRLRQICLVAGDIARVVGDLQAVLGLEVCHVDGHLARYGLENRLLPVGNEILEVVAPIRAGTAAGRYLERRDGDGGYMVITQCDDHAPRRQRVAELGVRVVNTIDRNGFHAMQLHPKDTGGTFFEIDFQEGGDAPDGPWEPAGPGWQAARRMELVDAIVAAEIQSPEPDALAARWAEIAQIAVHPSSPQGSPALRLENASVRFVPVRDGRGEGLAGIDVRAPGEKAVRDRARARGLAVERDTITIGGIRWRLV